MDAPRTAEEPTRDPAQDPAGSEQEHGPAPARTPSRPAARRARLPAALTALAAVGALALTACGSQPSTGSAQAPDGADPALAALYEQELEWGDCEGGGGGLGGLLGGGDLECAQLSVPVDYAQPAGETTEVALSRLASSGDASQGALLVNPGGPGASGVDLMGAAEQVFADPVREAYDIVSFDPRGVARSDGIECLDDEQMDAWRSQAAVDPQGQPADDLRQEYRELGESCAEDSGPVLEHMGTGSVARDLDLMRAALGQERTDYLGFSYGTHIGAEYAGLFPERVGRFVLDAGVDPTLSTHEIALGQARGFDESMRRFMEDCVTSQEQCFTDGSVEQGLTEVREILARTEREELTGDGGRRVSAVQAAEGMIAPLYTTATYSILNEALRDADDGDYAALQELSDANHGRQSDGTYRGNSTEAFTAVSCLDTTDETATDEDMARDQRELSEQAPTFGPYLGYTEAACQGWPYGPADEQTGSYTGETEILVVGATQDPATPYAWSEALTEQLGAARLLTRDGLGHVSYTSGNGCIVESVDAYLLEGALPEEDTVCPDVGL